MPSGIVHAGLSTYQAGQRDYEKRRCDALREKRLRRKVICVLRNSSLCVNEEFAYMKVLVEMLRRALFLFDTHLNVERANCVPGGIRSRN